MIRVAPLSSYAVPGAPAEEARTRVRSLMDHLAAETQVAIDWNEDGNEILAKPWDAFDLHAVRSLAAHHDYPPKILFVRQKFRLRADPRHHPSLRRIFAGADTSFPHLMRHSDNKGLWVPVPFAQPVVADDPNWWMVGSVFGVIDELDRIEPLLASTERRMQEAFGVLREIFTTAAKARLPVIIQ